MPIWSAHARMRVRGRRRLTVGPGETTLACLGDGREEGDGSKDGREGTHCYLGVEAEKSGHGPKVS